MNSRGILDKKSELLTYYRGYLRLEGGLFTLKQLLASYQEHLRRKDEFQIELKLRIGCLAEVILERQMGI